MTRPVESLGAWSAADRVVPPTGHTGRLSMFTAAVMAFLAVLTLALSLAAQRLSDRWEQSLSDTATVRIAAPADQAAAQLARVREVLATTPGVAGARVLEPAETQALLAPWFGPDLPVETLPLPVLIDVAIEAGGLDGEGLRLRLAAEAPDAVFDDHTRWRAPVVQAAGRLRLLALVSLALIGAATAAMIALAAQAALAANGQVIGVLRLVGAGDAYIARAFVRRFTIRAATGATAGTALGMVAVAFLPRAAPAAGILPGLGFQGADWLWPLTIPLMAAIVAFAATRAAAFRNLKGIR